MIAPLTASTSSAIHYLFIRSTTLRSVATKTASVNNTPWSVDEFKIDFTALTKRTLTGFFAVILGKTLSFCFFFSFNSQETLMIGGFVDGVAGLPELWVLVMISLEVDL